MPLKPSKKPRAPRINRSPSGPARIAKVIARAGLCSRREAEVWIADGRVSVNGAVIASPALNVAPGDRIAVDGALLPEPERTRLFRYNKPRGLVTSTSDKDGRPTIFGALPKHLPRLISVGRLDIGTEGLLLLTNDGGLARVLELPETGWLRRYRVRAHGSVTQDVLDGLRPGIKLDGVSYGPIEAAVDRVQGSNTWLTFAIREGKNREVRKVLEHLGLQVNRLIRVSFGPFQLVDLPEGEIEEVKTRTLRDQLGERIAKAANADFSAPIIIRGPERDLPPEPERRERREKSDRPARDKPGEKRPDKGQRERRPERGEGRGRPAPVDDKGRPTRDPKRAKPGGRRAHFFRERPPEEAAARKENPRAPTVRKRGTAVVLKKRVKRSDEVADRKGRSVRVERFKSPEEKRRESRTFGGRDNPKRGQSRDAPRGRKR